MLKSRLPRMKRPFVVLLTFFLFLLTYQGHTQFIINNSFKTNDETGIVRGGGAKLTSGDEDPTNEGWLRLTSDANNQSGYAYVATSFPSSSGVLIEFEYSTWRSKHDIYGGADGITVFLFDATVPIFRVGAFGGSLGYAPFVDGSVNTPGLSRGYIGIGLDEFGNYSNPTEGRTGGIGYKPNSIAMRGPESSNYAYVAGTQLPQTSQGAIQAGGPFTTRPASTDFYRRVQLSIKPVGSNYSITLKWKTSETGDYTQLFSAVMASPPPATLRLGFAASTGSGINNHEIRNLRITTPGNVSIEQTVDKLTATKGDQLKYTITVRNDSDEPAIGLPVSMEIRDANGNLIPASLFSIDDIAFSNGGYAGNKVTTQPTKNNPLSAVVELEANSSATFVVTGTIKGLPPGGIIKSDATITPANALPTAIPDIDLSNNKASVSSTVSGPDLSLTKSAASGTYSKVGDKVNYTMILKNTGTVVVSNIVITDANADAGSISPVTYASLAVGASVTINATHTVTQADLDRGYVSNLAKADGKSPTNADVHAESTDPAPVSGAPTDPSCAACTITPVTQLPAFDLTKTVAEATYRATGDVLHYTITVKNTGNVALNNIVVTDPLTGLNQTVALLAAGASETINATYTVKVADLSKTAITNVVTAVAKTPAGQSLTKTATATSTLNRSELTLTKTATAATYSKVGDKISYTMVLKNTGNQLITGIVITDANADGNSITPATIASLAIGASTTITATHTITQADLDRGYVSNLAKADGKDASNVNVHAESTDPTPLPGAPVDPTCTPCTVTPVVQSPKFELKKVVTETSYKAVGDIVHYTITVKNTGNVSLSAIQVTDPLTSLNRTIAVLAVGATETITTTHTVVQADLDNASIVNTATATAKTPAGNTLTETASATIFFIIDGKEVFIPNVITPNGDGKNDQFRIPQLVNYPGSELMIFNRWGNMVYRSSNYQNDWDGRGLNEGTYYYALLLNKPTGKVRYAGWVQLLR